MTVYYENLFEDDIEMLSISSKFMISEPCPSGDGAVIESIFENGIDLVEYIDKHKLLQDNTNPFPNIETWIFRKLNYVFQII